MLYALREKIRDNPLAVVNWATPVSVTRAMQTQATPITVAYGDGIGPEIMDATLSVLAAAQARIDPRVIEVGEKVYRRGFASGIAPDAWRTLRDSKAFLKAPVTTPQGGGLKSVNVTLRKVLGLYANIRPCVAFAPFMPTRSAGMNVVVIRENEEDVYAGIEHRQTDDVFQCLKLISRSGSERVIRYAFEFAQANGRRKVTCLTKDNIMKLTDGVFHRVFQEVAAAYPAIKSEHLIVDYGIARLATRPEGFDVVVAPNLYGDIVSDVAAEVAGSIGLAGSANVGHYGAMFEAVHGSAPAIAGTGSANPSGLLAAAVMMLRYLGQDDVAECIHRAWLKTLEDGIHTADCFDARRSKKRVGTRQFAQAVIDRLGDAPRRLTAGTPCIPAPTRAPAQTTPVLEKSMVGVDVFLHWCGVDASALAQSLQQLDGNGLALAMITNRGVKVWPNGFTESLCTDHWRCRFVVTTDKKDCA